MPAEDSFIRIVHPRTGYETFESSIFVMGQAAEPVLLNGQPIALSPLGYFSRQVVLADGNNTLAFQSLSDASRSLDLTVYRHAAVPLLPAETLDIQPETLDADGNARGLLGRRPGEWVTLAVNAAIEPGDSEAVRLAVHIPEVLDAPIPMRRVAPEAAPDAFLDNRETVFAVRHQTRARIPLAGRYHCRFQIPHQPAGAPINDAGFPIRITVTGPLGSREHELPLSLAVWVDERSARVMADSARVHATDNPAASGGQLGPLPQGTRLALDGQDGDRLRLRYAPGRHGWIDRDDVAFDAAWHPPSARLRSARVSAVDAFGSRLNIPLGGRPPFDIAAETDAVHLTLFDTAGALGFVHYPEGESRLECVSAERLGDNAHRLRFAVPGLCGYDAAYAPDPATGEDCLCLTVRTLPEKPADLRILVDAGHGGAETGATGLNGVPEKDYNLIVASRLHFALESAGYRVCATRLRDIDVSLAERVRMTREFAPHLIVSLHHNALPDGRDPQAHRGICSLYYQPFARAFAMALQSELVAATGMPSEGLYLDSLTITRLTEGMAVLVELGYFTHPGDFERVTAPDYVDAVVAGVLSAIAEMQAGA